MRELCRRTNKEYTKYCLAYSLFQSPSSVWRTTAPADIFGQLRAISIHVLHVEDDQVPTCTKPFCSRFQSTSSMWRTTSITTKIGRASDISIHVLHVEDDRLVYNILCVWTISIHVLHVEDDSRLLIIMLCMMDFNPRPPCGGRLSQSHQLLEHPQFQSTSSMWRTTPL